jgi:peroxiredoxin
MNRLVTSFRVSSVALMFLTLMRAEDAAEFHFSLKDASGNVHTEKEWSGKKTVVLIFIATDCPISNSYIPELKRLNVEYVAQGVVFYAVQSDPTESSDRVTQYAQEFGYTFPVLLDPQQKLARHTGASITPEAAVLSPSGRLLYLGRIDDKYPSLGKSRYAASQFDLKDAIAAAVLGKPIVLDRTKAVGCAIPFEMRAKQ